MNSRVMTDCGSVACRLAWVGARADALPFAASCGRYAPAAAVALTLPKSTGGSPANAFGPTASDSSANETKREIGVRLIVKGVFIFCLCVALGGDGGRLEKLACY